MAGVGAVIGWGVLGLAVGAFGTLIGAGGGFILLPILVLAFPHESPDVLTAISLTVVFANASSGTVAYLRMRRVDVRAGLLFALAGLPGSIAGALLTRALPRRVFDPVLGCVLILGAAIMLVRPAPRGPDAGTGTRRLVDADGEVLTYSPRLGLGVLLSLGVGFISSLLGIGGGILHVPLMAYVLGFPTHVATATSHFVLAILAFAGVMVHATTGSLAAGLGQALPLAAGVLLGAQAGARLSSRVHGKWILRGLALALASVGVRLLLSR